jgi:hypothetical protein
VLCAESQDDVRRLFFLAHGPNARLGKVLAVIVGYFDDSNTHRGAKILSLCGFLADYRQWEDFEMEWKKILDKTDWPNRPSEFHAYDIVHHCGEFERWNLAQRLAFYGDMTGLLAECNLLALGSLCVTEAYENRSDEEKALLAKGGLFGPIDFVFQYLVSEAIASTRRYGQVHTPPVEFEELALVFDEADKPVAERFHGLYNHLRLKHPHGNMLQSITFESSHRKAPLQAADMLAYTTYHWHLKQMFPNESDFDFPIVPGFLRLIQNVAAAGGIYNENAMAHLVLQERINRINKDQDPFFF